MRESLTIARDSLVLVEVADDEPAERERLEERVRALGLCIARDEASGVTWVLRSRRASQIAAMLGAASDRRFVSEDELDRVRVVARDDEARSQEEPTPFHALAQQVATLARRAPSRERTAEARALLHDPRVSESSLRTALIAIVETAAPTEALEALGAAIALRRGSATSEVVSFGRLVARGARRFEVDGPFAIELDDPRDECAPSLLAWFRAAERYQRLCDERGFAVHRALFRAIPWLDAVSESLPPSLALLRALEDSDSARVWIAGVVLPAALPWALWTTLLGQRARR
ncbi:MAG: hypothetical protein U0269_02985 [Polyangiales bacterium]